MVPIWELRVDALFVQPISVPSSSKPLNTFLREETTGEIVSKLEAEVYEAEMDEDDEEEVANMEEALEDMMKEGEEIEKSYGEDEIVEK